MTTLQGNALFWEFTKHVRISEQLQYGRDIFLGSTFHTYMALHLFLDTYFCPKMSLVKQNQQPNTIYDLTTIFMVIEFVLTSLLCVLNLLFNNFHSTPLHLILAKNP